MSDTKPTVEVETQDVKTEPPPVAHVGEGGKHDNLNTHTVASQSTDEKASHDTPPHGGDTATANDTEETDTQEVGDNSDDVNGTPGDTPKAAGTSDDVNEIPVDMAGTSADGGTTEKSPGEPCLMDSNQQDLRMHSVQFSETAQTETAATGAQISKMSVRQRTLTDKGKQYQLDQAISAFKNCVKHLKQTNTKTMKFIESGDANVGQMFEFRENLEKNANSLSDNYFNIGEFSTVELANMKSLYDECLSRNSTTMFKLTQAMRWSVIMIMVFYKLK